MEIVEHWDALLEFLVESRESANLETITGGSVHFELLDDRTLRARFDLLALIVNCVEYDW